MQNFIRDEQGATAIEYGLLAALIMFVFLAIAFFGFIFLALGKFIIS